MVQVCGKEEVLRESVQVERPIKFWVILPRAVMPSSMMKRVWPPKKNT